LEHAQPISTAIYFTFAATRWHFWKIITDPNGICTIFPPIILGTVQRSMWKDPVDGAKKSGLGRTELFEYCFVSFTLNKINFSKIRMRATFKNRIHHLSKSKLYFQKKSRKCVEFKFTLNEHYIFSSLLIWPYTNTRLVHHLIRVNFYQKNFISSILSLHRKKRKNPGPPLHSSKSNKPELALKTITTHTTAHENFQKTKPNQKNLGKPKKGTRNY
jgi:hypothetical protein